MSDNTSVPSILAAWVDDYEGALAQTLHERDKARRVAVSLEADLARILDAWDDYRADAAGTPELPPLRAALDAARERVGTDTRAECHNGHAFQPGVDEDGGPSSPDWCNVCGERRQVGTDTEGRP